MHRRKPLTHIALVSLLVLGAATLASCSRGQATPASQGTPAASTAPVRVTSDIVAEGKLLPVLRVALSSPVAGYVAEVAAPDGGKVEAGQVIVRLNNAQQAAAVAQAEAALLRAQAHLDELKAGARKEEVSAAAAALDAAKAQLAKLTEGPRPEDIAAAEAGLAAAGAELQRVQEGAAPGQLIAAQADLANAQAALQTAQAAYDRIAGTADVGARPEGLALQQATNSLAAAKARYEDLTKGGTAAELAKARAGVLQAEAELQRVKAPARPSDIAAAGAEVQRVDAQYRLVGAGVRPEQIAAAEADVAAARAEVERARAILADTEIRAPFAGVLVGLDARAGEQVAAGVPLAYLADPVKWEVETTDLTEIKVANVAQGSPVLIRLDALPGEQFDGVVTNIESLGRNQQGDIVYKTTIALNQVDPRFRWNMTAQAEISTE